MSRSFELVLRGLASPAFYLMLLASAVGYLVPYAIQRALLSRLDEERRARAWNGLTWACAILWLPSPLTMIAFAWVTRRGAGLRRRRACGARKAAAAHAAR